MGLTEPSAVFKIVAALSVLGLSASALANEVAAVGATIDDDDVAPVSVAPDIEPVVQQLWAGNFAVVGQRKIPLLGTINFRTDTRMLARATQTPTGWSLEQETCRVDFARAAGADVSLDPTAPSNLPNVTFDVRVDGEVFSAGPWDSSWGDDDHDKDGNPGVTFHVKAPLCGGQLHIGNSAKQTLNGAVTDDFIASGTLRVWVEQRILGARGACLKLMSRDSSEWMDGWFAYKQVPADTTCEALELDDFPDPAPGQ